jgi:hypothetical protein
MMCYRIKEASEKIVVWNDINIQDKYSKIMRLYFDPVAYKATLISKGTM